MRRSWRKHDDGAAVVEFALVVPVLLVLVFGIIEFGRIYNAQLSVSTASREAARTMAVLNDYDGAIDDAINAASSLNPALTAAEISIVPASCQPGVDVEVTVTYPMEFLTGFIGNGVTLTGRGVMRCGG